MRYLLATIIVSLSIGCEHKSNLPNIVMQVTRVGFLLMR